MHPIHTTSPAPAPVQALQLQAPVPQPYALHGKARESRRNYLQAMLRIGFSFLELHLLNPDGTCSCPWYSSTRRVSEAEKARRRADGTPVNACKNPGKHPVRLASESIMTDVDAIEAHLDKGGSLGMVLRLEGLPMVPMRLVILDCDREGSREWLEARGITSPLMVRGKRGWHFYALLPADCPDLRSDTRTLNPGSKNPTTDEQPGIDIKVSGHVVTPFSPNKTLIFNGQDISENPAAVERIFQDMASLAAVLPVIDPRVLVPTMKEFVPGAILGGVRIRLRRTVRTKRIRLSKAKVHRDKIESPLKGLPYRRRKDMAIDHVKRATPGKGDELARGGAMLRVLYALSRHYWLSEEDRLRIVMDHYNPRLRDADGSRHPFRTCELRRMVRRSSRGDVVSPFGLDGKESPYAFDVQAELARLRKLNLRSNGRRERNRQQDASLIHAEVRRFIHEECITSADKTIRILQGDLHRAYEDWTADQQVSASATKQRFGRILNELGFETGWIGHNSDQCRLGIDLLRTAAA